MTSAIPVRCSTNWATKPHNRSKVNLLSSGVLSIRWNIPVWNSGYSIRQMEQYFPVRWINPSQVIRFQVLLKNTKSNRGLFYLSLLALGLLDDSEVEINNNYIGWEWQYNFYRTNLKGVQDYFPDEFKGLFQIRASCSLDGFCSHFTHLTCIFAVLTKSVWC